MATSPYLEIRSTRAMMVVAAGYTVHLPEGTQVSFMCLNYVTLPRCSTYLQPENDRTKWENSIIGAHKNIAM
jgi:hypothetical protein